MKKPLPITKTTFALTTVRLTTDMGNEKVHFFYMNGVLGFSFS